MINLIHLFPSPGKECCAKMEESNTDYAPCLSCETLR